MAALAICAFKDGPSEHHGTRGTPDFVLLLPGARVLLIEAKRPNQKPSPAQLAWHLEAAKLGHEVHIVHSMEEFKLVLLKTFHQQEHP